jgi:folylpolyglutamate synthase/dihydropteroate synthase
MFASWKPRLQMILATHADHPRALKPEKILELARQAGVPCEAIKLVADALDRALELAGEQSIILSAGSMFVTAEVMTAWRKRKVK